MMQLVSHLRTRPRLVLCTVAGVAVALLTPGVSRGVTRALIGWDVGVWLFLVLVAVMMTRAGQDHVKRTAVAQAEGALAVLSLVVLAVVASIVAILIELSAVKGSAARYALPHVALTLATVIGSWLLLPTLFSLNYASEYYVEHGHALNFPDRDESFRPDYADFLYFSFTIAVAAQTADVSVTSRRMRRLVLAQAVLSFAFNTVILAFSVNIAASLF